MGSKNRIAKFILPIILKERKPEQWYVEPFAGGMNGDRGIKFSEGDILRGGM